MHIRVINPVLIVSDGALARLKLFNQKILEEANHNMYRRFGMPLIGAGMLLSAKFDHGQVFYLPTLSLIIKIIPLMRTALFQHA